MLPLHRSKHFRNLYRYFSSSCLESQLRISSRHCRAANMIFSSSQDSSSLRFSASSACWTISENSSACIPTTRFVKMQQISFLTVRRSFLSRCMSWLKMSGCYRTGIMVGLGLAIKLERVQQVQHLTDLLLDLRVRLNRSSTPWEIMESERAVGPPAKLPSTLRQATSWPCVQPLLPRLITYFNTPICSISSRLLLRTLMWWVSTYRQSVRIFSSVRMWSASMSTQQMYLRALATLGQSGSTLPLQKLEIAQQAFWTMLSGSCGCCMRVLMMWVMHQLSSRQSRSSTDSLPILPRTISTCSKMIISHFWECSMMLSSRSIKPQSRKSWASSCWLPARLARHQLAQSTTCGCSALLIRLSNASSPPFQSTWLWTV